MEKILISACLVGDKTRYDGKGCYNPLIKELLKYYELVPFCPEVEGGLKSPRKKSERRGDLVLNEEGLDVTENFKEGASRALVLCKYLNIKLAILKDRSPSCGSTLIYNGYFENSVTNGKGVTAELLIKNKIKVINEDGIQDLIKEKEDNQQKYEEIRDSILKKREENKKKKEERKDLDTNEKNFDKQKFNYNKEFKNKRKFSKPRRPFKKEFGK